MICQFLRKLTCAVWPSDPTAGYLPKRSQNLHSHENLYVSVDSGIIHGSEILEITQMSFHRTRDRQTEVHPRNAMPRTEGAKPAMGAPATRRTRRSISLSVVKLIEHSGRGWRTDKWCPGLRGWFDYKEAAQGRLGYALSSLCRWLSKSMQMLKSTEVYTPPPNKTASKQKTQLHIKSDFCPILSSTARRFCFWRSFRVTLLCLLTRAGQRPDTLNSLSPGSSSPLRSS